jgi:flagellar motor switch protein FliG
VHVDTDAYVRSVLTKALGDDKASNLISRILQPGDTNGIEGLKWMDAPTVADLIKNEHPQIIATILVHLGMITPATSSTSSPSACATTSCCASRPSKASSRKP